EEMDLKVLQFRNKKLAERLEQRQVCEDELRERIEKLEKRQATDDATLHLVNRFWAQVRGHTWAHLGTPGGGKEELDAEVQALLRRCDGDGGGGAGEAWAGPEEGAAAPPPPRLSFAPEAVARLGGALGRAQRGLQHLGGHLSARPELPEPGRELLRELLREHRRLQELTLALHEKHQREALQLAELQDKAGWAETKVLELGTTLEGLQWDSAKLRKREGRLDRHLAEALEQVTHLGLANSRMAELEKLQLELQAAVRGQERLKVALRSLPEEAVKEALEYKVLQSQFSLLYHESLQVKTQLDEARALLLATKNSHLRHIEHMESDELGVQKRLRTEVIQLEDTLAQVRKEYEMLRIEFEQNLAANEQAGPINREMRHLISSLQNHNHQLKGDVQRYKRKLREVQAEINKVGGAWPPGGVALEELRGRWRELEERERRENKKPPFITLKELRGRWRELEERERRENKKPHIAQPHGWRPSCPLRLLMVAILPAPLTAAILPNPLMAAILPDSLMAAILPDPLMEEEALLSEMDVTGQAFEDMQEQNLRLLQQLREKDDANFKLMSERIKANQIHKLLREEKDELAEQVLALKAQVEAQLQVVQKLEEKERGLQSALAAVEKELSLRSQALELHKRKAVEAAQLAEDLRAQGEHVQARLRELQL
uniref:E3 ubiquitin-protein ligase BRE1B n=1 Tax=Lonchura striata TaxID=40157 RepID=UPI0012941200